MSKGHRPRTTPRIHGIQSHARRTQGKTKVALLLPPKGKRMGRGKKGPVGQVHIRRHVYPRRRSGCDGSSQLTLLAKLPNNTFMSNETLPNGKHNFGEATARLMKSIRRSEAREDMDRMCEKPRKMIGTVEAAVNLSPRCPQPMKSERQRYCAKDQICGTHRTCGSFLDQIQRGDGILVEDERGLCAMPSASPTTKTRCLRQDAARQRIERVQKTVTRSLQNQNVSEADIDQLLQD